MFEMSQEQIDAANNAMSNATVAGYSHLILFVLALIVVLWFFLCIYGQFKAMQKGQIDFGELLGSLMLSATVFVMAAIFTIYV